MATLLTLGMALVLAFTAVTINVGRTAMRKTKFSNACDGAAINFASQVGSWAHYLSETYLDGDDSQSFSVWSDIWKALAFVVQCVVAIWVPVFWVTAAATLVSMGVDYAIEADQLKAMDRQFAKLSRKQNFIDGAILYGMMGLVDDMTMKPDINDYDEDGQTDDLINAFYEVYQFHLRALTATDEASQLFL